MVAPKQQPPPMFQSKKPAPQEKKPQQHSLSFGKKLPVSSFSKEKIVEKPKVVEPEKVENVEMKEPDPFDSASSEEPIITQKKNSRRRFKEDSSSADEEIYKPAGQ
jgi:hypothetical protein